jgi:Arc/MetJ family transcription regulator
MWATFGGLHDLGVLPSGTFSSAADINDVATVTGVADGPGKAVLPQRTFLFIHTQFSNKMVYDIYVARTNIDIDEGLLRRARKLTRLKTKRQIVDKALELLVRSETRKGILRYYGTGVWRGDLKLSRRNRV